VVIERGAHTGYGHRVSFRNRQACAAALEPKHSPNRTSVRRGSEPTAASRLRAGGRPLRRTSIRTLLIRARLRPNSG
jgi:hypothetical protein